jgi:hypothetical protein
MRMARIVAESPATAARRQQEAKEEITRTIHREEEMSREAYWVAALMERKRERRIAALKAAQDTKISQEKEMSRETETRGSPMTLDQMETYKDSQYRRGQRIDMLVAQEFDYKKIADETPMSPEVLKGLQMSVQLTVDQQLQQKLAERRTEREVTRRLALVDSYGEDVYPVGTIISFEKKFDGAPETFTYAVIKGTDTKWFTTGHNHVYGSTLTWDALVEFLVASNPVTSVVIKPEGGATLPAPAVTK